MATKSNNNWLAVLLGALAVVAGSLALANTPAPVPTPSTTTSTTTTSSSPTVPSQPGAAIWKRPVSDFGVHPRSAEYAARCFLNCSLTGPGKISTYFDAYSVPTYDIRTATLAARVYKAAPVGFAGSIRNGALIPWNPSWTPGTGNDLIMVLLNPGPATTLFGVPVAAGQEIDLWLVFTPPNQTPCRTFDNAFATPPLDPTTYYVCAGGADIIQDQNGLPVDYRTVTTTYPTGGGWFDQHSMIVTPADVQSGRISHALDLTVYNTMFGPQCTTVERSDPTKAGVTCGYFEPPASNLEFGGTARPGQTENCGTNTMPFTDAQRAKTVPEGMRFFIVATDQQIAAWLDSRSYTGALRETARIFAVAVRDYGMIVTNTACYAGGIRTTGRVGPDKAAWDALGIPSNPDTAVGMLDGLITASNLRAAGPSAPPVVGSAKPR